MKKIVISLVFLIIIIFYIHPFLKLGYFPTHDGEWAIIRLAEMQREVKDGQFPPRWSDFLNHGYGYPLFLYTYPFPFYLGLPLLYIHVGLVDTIKIIFVVSVITSAVSMYLLGRELLGVFAGMISSVFYITAPYKLVNLYVRGSIGESLSLAFVPLLFYSSLKYLKKPSLHLFTISVIIYSTVLLTHNVMALLFTPLWFVFLTIIPIKNIFYRGRLIIPILFLSWGLSAYFIFPALLEKKYIILSQIQLADRASNFINLSEYINSIWSFGIKPSFQVGIYQIIATLLGIFLVFWNKKRIRKEVYNLSVFIISGIIIVIFLGHPISWFLWNFPPLSFLDFPWRLMGPLIFLLALSSVFLCLSNLTRLIGIGLLIVTVVTNLNFVKPVGYLTKNDMFYYTNDATTTSADELMPINVLDKPERRYEKKVQVENGECVVNNLDYKSQLIIFNVNAIQQCFIKVNTIFFPGWKFYLDGEKITINNQNRDGLIRLSIPDGTHHILGKFERTGIRLFADVVTMLSLLIVMAIIAKLIKKSLRVYER